MARSGLSTGDYIFLALLRVGPRSAYDVKKAMASSVNFFWSAQHSQVYQQAARLRRDGFIEARGSASSRNRQLLALTDDGLQTLEEWLAQPARPYRIYDESLAKVYFANLGDARGLLDILAHVQAHHTELLSEFEELHRVLAEVDFGDVLPGQLYALRLGIAVERAYLRWVRETMADIERRPSRTSIAMADRVRDAISDVTP
jgi:PadR family transcriptional regulator AphA